ncbi:MAG: DUF4388 domain-containing protein [Proteobacteria bacterium]|nr:DUF4388 domain-containing protein [Pseudomonadota bacterium]
MQGPLCEVIALGEVSSWAKQLLNHWQSEDLIQVSYESSVASFCNRTPSSQTVQIVVLENGPACKTGLSLLQSSPHDLLIILMGQSFTKEDCSLALENKVFGLIENPQLSDKRAHDLLARAAEMRSQKSQLAHLIRSLKGLVLQSESKNSDPEMISEMKTGLGKVEKLVHQSNTHSGSSILPLAQSQGLGDVLLTLSELERTGTLWVRGAKSGQEGKIDFLQGKITFAETGSVQQLKAIYRMFSWDSPRFLFNRKAPESYESGQLIPIEMSLLVQEGEKQTQRFKQIQKQVPPLELKVDFVAQSLNDKTSLSPNDFHTLIQVVEYHYVSDILDYSEKWDVDLFEGLISLKKSGHIKVMVPASQAV